MKIYEYDKKVLKWYKRIDWIKLVIVTLIAFLVIFLIFNYLGNWKYLTNATKRSFLISGLIALDLILRDLLENRDLKIIVKDREIFYVQIHNRKDGKFLSDNEYEDILMNTTLDEIIRKNDKYEGIDTGKIISVNNIKNRINRIVVDANVKEKIWKPKGWFFSSKINLIEKEHRRKIDILKSVNNFEELEQKLKKINK